MADNLSVTSSQPLPDLSVVDSQPTQGAPPVDRGASTVQSDWDTQHPAAAGIRNAAGELVRGVGEGVADTATGLNRGLNHLLPNSMQLPDAPGRTMPGEEKPLARKAGNLLETVGEFAAGDAAVTAASKALNIAQKFPQLVALMDKYPKWASIIMKTIQGGAVGGAQGAVKGEATSDQQAKSQALGGVAGGAIGGGIGEATAVGGRMVMNHMFGDTPEKAFEMAARPYVKDVNFADSATRAIPRIEAAAKAKPFKTIDGFVDLLDEERNNIWQKEYEPLVKQHANDVVDGNPVAQAIRAKKTLAMTALPSIFKNETEEIESIAKDFDNFNLKIPEAGEVLKSLNAKLNGFYRMSAAERQAARVTDGQLTALEGAADALRDQIDAKLGTGASEIRRDYGAMKDMHRIFSRRAMVYNRQAPISLPQALGGIEATAAVLSGHPIAALAGAVPFASRWANSPGTLIRRGLSLSSPSGAAAAVRSAAPQILSNVGAQVGRAAAPSDEQPDEVR